MKKNLLTFIMMVLVAGVHAQTPRLSLYEEFTGETCPPCASTNPGLNLLLASPTNTPKIVAIKWQVPIPSAPSNTWSLYQTNKTEIDWRWKSIANGGYGYNPVINSAPSSKIDGREATVFGAASGHPANLNNNVISTAQSFTSAFSVTMSREWDATCSAVNLTVNIQATAPFTSVGNLVFRTVMVERLIQFSVQPGTNGEKIFEDAAIKSFPTLQNGVPMASVWTVGQTQTFTLNCPLPSYTRKRTEVAFVGFIQDDGNQRVAQAVRAEKALLINDAAAVSAKVNAVCSGTLAPVVTVANNGSNAITALTITPYSDGTSGNVTTWTGSLPSGSSTTIALNSISTSTVSGTHTFSYNIVAMNGTDFDLSNNGLSVKFPVTSAFQGTPVAEGFISGAFPPASWTSVNSNGGTNSWSRVTNAGGYGFSNESTKYDFFNNTVIGDQDELYLPPMNLAGFTGINMTFDYSYVQRTANSNDKLDVLVSPNCGANWYNAYSASGSALATVPTPQSTAFTPNAADPSHWNTTLVSFGGYNVQDILVKFVVTNDNGNNLYIDNVNLQQANVVGLTKGSLSFNASMYPNPANGSTNLSINSPNAGKAKVSIANTLGQLVYNKEVTLELGANSIEIDLKELTNGVYNVSIDTNKGTIVKKLSVNK